MAARIVDALPDEMTREGFDILTADDKDASEAMEARCEELDVLGTYHEAMCLARCTGGAGILVGAVDGTGPNGGVRPLQLSSTRRNSVRPPTTRIPPPGSSASPRSTGCSRTPRRTARRSLVHESRIVRFEGVRLTRAQMRENNGWGDSVLPRSAEVLRDFHATRRGLLQRGTGADVLRALSAAGEPARPRPGGRVGNGPARSRGAGAAQSCARG